MAAASASLDLLKADGFLEAVQEKSQLLVKELKEAMHDKKSVVDIRGLGYMIGIETTGDLPDLVARARAKGLIVLTAGTNVIRLLPPLTITNDHIHQAVSILSDVFD